MTVVKIVTNKIVSQETFRALAKDLAENLHTRFDAPVEDVFCIVDDNAKVTLLGSFDDCAFIELHTVCNTGSEWNQGHGDIITDLVTKHIGIEKSMQVLTFTTFAKDWVYIDGQLC